MNSHLDQTTITAVLPDLGELAERVGDVSAQMMPLSYG
jgi:hypothetical protein